MPAERLTPGHEAAGLEEEVVVQVPVLASHIHEQRDRIPPLLREQSADAHATCQSRRD